MATQTRTDRIKSVLEAKFTPAELRVQDDSARHAGHAGAAPEGETHFSVMMVSPVFASLSRVDRSRTVHDALKDEFAAGLHAISLLLRAPGER
jgi:stress-induced morphogen